MTGIVISVLFVLKFFIAVFIDLTFGCLAAHLQLFDNG